MEDLMKMLSKKEDSIDENEKMSKMKVLEELRELASMMLGGDMDDMQKVTVAAEDEEGLTEGLEKAKELLEDEE